VQFGATRIEGTMAKPQRQPKAKDLPPKKGGTIKGGKLSANENLTLIRIGH
jgi:hypothetical protein